MEKNEYFIIIWENFKKFKKILVIQRKFKENI